MTLLCQFAAFSATLPHSHNTLIQTYSPQDFHRSKIEKVNTLPNFNKSSHIHTQRSTNIIFTQCSNSTLHYLSVKLVLCGQRSKRLMLVAMSSGNKWIWVHLDCFYGHEILHLEGAFHSKSARPQALYHLRRQFKFRRPPWGLEDWTMDIWSLEIWIIRSQLKKESNWNFLLNGWILVR